MKAIFAFILMIILGVLSSIFLPWWTITIVCFLVGLTFIDKGGQAALIGFISVFLIWGVFAFLKSYQNDYILLERMSALLPIHNTWAILLITAALGGLLGMLSAMSGVYLQTINEKPKRNKYY